MSNCFSTSASIVGARTTESRDDVTTTVYFDDWYDVAEYDGPLAHIHSSCDGFSFVFMPTADGRTIVLAQGRADAYAALPGEPDAVVPVGAQADAGGAEHVVA